MDRVSRARTAGGGRGRSGEKSIALTRGQRKRLVAVYRGTGGAAVCLSPQARLRAHIILLLADGYTWAVITAVLLCSTSTVSRCKRAFEAGGVEALLEERRGRRPVLAGWADLVAAWVRRLCPRDFGYFRSRWSCSALAARLWMSNRVRASAETVRRMLHAQGLAWNRPRPALAPRDPGREYKLRRIRELLRDLPANEAAVFQDEVDLNLNPEVGAMWMDKGGQAELLTPGTNVKRYLAGSMSWRTGELIVTEGARRDAALFVGHLRELGRRFSHFRVLHVICDNARFHTAEGSKLVRRFLEQCEGKVVLHSLPSYSPRDNPIERVWWHLREEVTRNHCCRDIRELVKLTTDWIQDRGRFKIEGRMYQSLKQRLKHQAAEQAQAPTRAAA